MVWDIIVLKKKSDSIQNTATAQVGARLVKTHRYLQMKKALLLCLVVGLGGGFAFDLQAAKTEPVYPNLFSTKEVRSKNFKPFKKWTEALSRYTQESATLKDGHCSDKFFNKCHFGKWQKFLKTLEGKDRRTQIEEVNRFMNKARYITDPVNWGEKDYWATPGQFMAKFGDCEDYAIAKFMSLAQLGFTDDDMRVVAVKDMNLKVGHAILVVYLEGKAYVLDNQIKKVAEADVIRHYVPVFSINQSYWWRHKKA